MSSLIQKAKDALNTSDADKTKAQEQLDFLLNAAKSKLTLYTMDLKDELAGVGSSSDNPIKIVGDPIAFEESYNCNVGSDANSGITSAINTFFPGSGGDVKTGFQSLVNVGLQAILGDTTLGENEHMHTFITMEHNAIIRVDIKVWRYNFSDTSIISSVQNAFCYVFCKSVVDHTKVTLDVLTYLISEQAGDKTEDVQAYISSLEQVWNNLQSISPTNVRNAFVRSMGAA